MLQYIPRTTSGIYWFNGIMHYNACTFTAIVAISMMIIFVRDGKKYTYVLATIATALIGGGNYQAALLPLMFWILLLIGQFFNFGGSARIRERFSKMLHAKRVWLLGIGILLELVGLAISGSAPMIFSKSDVSGGVPNTVQQIFLITSVTNVIYVIGYIQRILREKPRLILERINLYC